MGFLVVGLPVSGFMGLLVSGFIGWLFCRFTYQCVCEFVGLFVGCRFVCLWVRGVLEQKQPLIVFYIINSPEKD